MKNLYLNKITAISILLLSVLFVVNCSSDDSNNGDATASTIVITGEIYAFAETGVLSHSDAQSITVKGNHLASDMSITVSDNFQVSLDNSSFSTQLNLDKTLVNSSSQTVYVRFSPNETALGAINGMMTLESNSATTKTVALKGVGLSIEPKINVTLTEIDFDDTMVSEYSAVTSFYVNGDNLTAAIDLNASEGFELSLDSNTFTTTLQIPTETANDQTTVYVRFAPVVDGDVTGTITLTNADADAVELHLSGTGLGLTHNYKTFENQRLAFGGGFEQSSTQMFNLHDDLSNIKTIKMYVKLRCPSGGCDEWDVYANVKVKDISSGEMYEIGRYITPYWNDNSQLDRGFEFDVTDFKSLLTGSTELRIRTECWNAKGYEVSVEFDYIEGTPEYLYSAVSRVIAYDDWSSSGVPYGVDHSFDLNKSVSVPSNAESTHLRTIISGWGHATPEDADGRGCAEWCFRTHDVNINGATQFQHELEPLGCASNPVSNQSPGNWQANRAGWCPGMEVPVRIDQFDTAMAGSTFNFEYDYEDWTNNGGNGDAFYATSTFVVVKSNTPITKPVVTE